MSDSDSGDEIEVIEVKAANSLVPNLTISVEKDDEEPTVEFLDEEKGDKVDGCDIEVKLVPESFTHTKIYENKLLQDIGCNAEESRMKKQTRAKRFQSPLLREDVKPVAIEQRSIDDLIQKVNDFNEKNDIFKEIRLDAVHLRGLDDMSTDEIFKFFGDHYPSHIEWIDDTSCNVVWKDRTSAAGAVLDMSKPIVVKKVSEEKTEQDAKESEDGEKDDNVELDLMDSGDEEDKMEVEDGEPSQDNPDSNEPFDNPLRRCKLPVVKNGRKTLLKMRFANVNDKKTMGGANRSQYYRKYGNPNYGNVRGVLSRSFKKRYHGRVAKREFEEFKPEELETEPKSKVPTKRLYSELAWDDAKRARRDSGNLSEEEDATEKEDRELMNASVKDIEGAIPVVEKQNDKAKYDSMEADQISRKDIATENDSTPSGTLTVKVKVKNKGSVWDRLGNRDIEKKMQQDNTLPKSLRERLGTKKS